MTAFDPYEALVPIFLDNPLPKRLSQIGSGVFTEILSQPFLLTAAHVVDEAKNGELLVPTSDGLVRVSGYRMWIDLLPDMARRDDPVDVAYWRLSDEFAQDIAHHFSPLPETRRQLILSALELNVCSASGYPASKGKKNGNKFSSEIFSFRGVAASQETYDRLLLSPESSIIIHFDKRRAVDPETQKPFPTPSLRGISGGGLFAWPVGAELSDDWSLPNLVGIVHTYKEGEGLIIGTSLVSLLAAVTLGQLKRLDASR